MDPTLTAKLEELGGAFEQFKDRYGARIESLETMLARIEALGGVRPPARDRAIPKTARAAWDAFVRRGDVDALRDETLASAVRAATTLETQVDPGGGLFVPLEIDAEIERLTASLSPIRQLARVVTAKGEYRKIVRTGEAASGWVGETAGRPKTDATQYAAIDPPEGEIYANPGLSQKTLDVAPQAGEDLQESIAEEFASQEGAAFVTGTGVIKPRGFLTHTLSTDVDGVRPFGEIQYVPTGDANGFVVASATVSPADCLIDLVHALRAPYRRGGPTWLMNSLTLAEVRKFKDADGRFIVRPGIEAGAPELLLGYPVAECEDMPDIAANALPIAFGFWKRAYLIVDTMGTRVLRDPFTDKPNVLFYATRRVRGHICNYEALKALKVAAA